MARKRIELLNGDCLSVLKWIESNSVDALVTDPPAGISFMGKSWDGDKGGRKQWIAWMSEVMGECIRVLRPGAHGLIWALPRTSHWTATALEDAGFEIRDVVAHLFGSGFPKSLDVSKAIDKAMGLQRQRIAGGQGGTNKILGARKPGEAISGEARRWQGFGTALKPASEHWILVRKPCSEKTVAANVLKHGTGALNIDASRIGVADNDPNHRKPSVLGKPGEGSIYGIGGREGENLNIQGRFPANLVLSHSSDCLKNKCAPDCAVKRLDEQSGIASKTKQKIGAAPRKNIGFKLSPSSADKSDKIVNYATDGQQGASRFFYCAKISARERNSGATNSHPTVKPKKLMDYLIRMITPPGGIVLDPFMGSGSTGLAALEGGFQFLGIEKEDEYFAIAQARLNK